jgi:NAD(P)-dependent dehydrogenase (short-subunit alcohol dehydrogenase family)
MKKIVLVTGASSGLGLALTKKLLKEGFVVLAGVRNLETASLQYAAEYAEYAETLKNLDSTSPSPSPLHLIELDVTKKASIAAAIESILKRCPELQLPDHQAAQFSLVNNAGVCIATPLELAFDEDIDEQFDVNVKGLLRVTNACLPIIQRTGGRIVHIGSASGHLAMPYYGLYAASKFAVEAISDSMRRELRPLGIRVVLIEPGSIATPIWNKIKLHAEQRFEAISSGRKELYRAEFFHFMQANQKLTESRSTSEEDFSVTVLKALTAVRPKARYTVGSDAWMSKNVYRFVPSKILDRALPQSLPS